MPKIGLAAFLVFVLGAVCVLWAEPPQVPNAFDEATIRRLVENVDMDANAALLKGPYFLRRQAHPCPYDEALPIIDEASAKEEVGSHRWLLLRNLYGFGCLRAGHEYTGRGVDAYKDLIRHLAEVKVTDENARSINGILADCLSSFGTSKDRWGLESKNDDIEETVVLATRMYLLNEELDRIPLNFGRVQERFLVVTSIMREIERLIALNEEPSYIMLKRGAEIYATHKEMRGRAVTILLLAESELPKDSPAEANAFYSLLVDTLIKEAKKEEAIEAQRRRVAATGNGEARLAFLQYQAGEKEPLAILAKRIDARTAADADIKELAICGLEVKDVDLYVPLLETYLGADRERDVACELWARHILASYYAKNNEREKAVALLQIEKFADRIKTHETRMEQRRIQMTLKKILRMEKDEGE